MFKLIFSAYQTFFILFLLVSKASRFWSVGEVFSVYLYE